MWSILKGSSSIVLKLTTSREKKHWKDCSDTNTRKWRWKKNTEDIKEPISWQNKGEVFTRFSSPFRYRIGKSISTWSNLVPRVSLLLLQGREEERPWERGWTWSYFYLVKRTQIIFLHLLENCGKRSIGLALWLRWFKVCEEPLSWISYTEIIIIIIINLFSVKAHWLGTL